MSTSVCQWCDEPFLRFGREKYCLPVCRAFAREGRVTERGVYEMGVRVQRFDRARFTPSQFTIAPIDAGHAIFFTQRRKATLLMSSGSREVLEHKITLIRRDLCAPST